MEGKYTIELFAEKNDLTRQSALNKISKLKSQGYVRVSGGGRQKKIYTISKLPQKPTNGFYDIVNKYSPEKLVPKFEHYVTKKYGIENAIIDGLIIGDRRTIEATMHLFRHVKSWEKLFFIGKKKNLTDKILKTYKEARKTTKTKRIPKRYLK